MRHLLAWEVHSTTVPLFNPVNTIGDVFFQTFALDVSCVKQEITDDVSRPSSALQKVPSLSDLSDPESSLGKFLIFNRILFNYLIQ